MLDTKQNSKVKENFKNFARPQYLKFFCFYKNESTKAKFKVYKNFHAGENEKSSHMEMQMIMIRI